MSKRKLAGQSTLFDSWGSSKKQKTEDADKENQISKGTRKFKAVWQTE